MRPSEKLAFQQTRLPTQLALKVDAIESAHCADNLPDEEQIFYVSDNLDGDFRDNADDAFTLFKNDTMWENRKRLDDIVFRPKEKFPALQAADLLAYEFRSDLRNRFHIPREHEKWGSRTATKLLQRKYGNRARYWDEKAMREFLTPSV